MIRVTAAILERWRTHGAFAGVKANTPHKRRIRADKYPADDVMDEPLAR